ncbi:MAG: hypothetical protein DMG83_16465 [Acidobacteria bacterium]|nr:MAG: hypothetical protein DMG83_16465 [Acidobacteriota bacterium]
MKGKFSRVLPLGLALICLGAALLAVGCGSSSSRYRFVQASTGVPTNVDLEVDGKNVQTSIGFGQSASYHSSSSGSHKFGVFATGTTTNPYVSSSVSLGSGDTTLLAENAFTAIALAPYKDDNTAPTTGNVKLRIIQAAPTVAGSQQGVDVYVVPTASNYLSLSAQSYDVVVTVRGTQNIINSLTGTYPLTSGQIRTLVILDAATGGGPYGLIELNDLN